MPRHLALLPALLAASLAAAPAHAASVATIDLILTFDVTCAARSCALTVTGAARCQESIQSPPCSVDPVTVPLTPFLSDCSVLLPSALPTNPLVPFLVVHTQYAGDQTVPLNVAVVEAAVVLQGSNPPVDTLPGQVQLAAAGIRDSLGTCDGTTSGQVYGALVHTAT